MEQVLRRLRDPMEIPAFERHLAHLRRDFRIEVDRRKTGDAYRLGEFRAFVGQDDHLRHDAFAHPGQNQLSIPASLPATRRAPISSSGPSSPRPRSRRCRARPGARSKRSA